MDGRFDRSGKHFPIQSRVSVPLDGGGRVIQVRVGGTRVIQDGEGRDGGFRENFETQRRTSTYQIANGRRQRILQQDVSSLDDTKGIRHFSTSGDTKASVVERFNRTLKKRLYRYFTVKNTLKYLPVLKELVLGYNRSYHCSIKMAPKKVRMSNEGRVWKTLYAPRLGAKRQTAKLKVGDRVRLNKNYRVFKKSYLPGWTKEVFLVARVMP